MPPYNSNPYFYGMLGNQATPQTATQQYTNEQLKNIQFEKGIDQSHLPGGKKYADYVPSAGQMGITDPSITYQTAGGYTNFRGPVGQPYGTTPQGATIIKPADMPNEVPEVTDKSSTKEKNKAASAATGNVLGLVTGASKALFPAQYDQEVGMEKPNDIQLMTDFSAASTLSAFGPVGTAVGAVVDVGKNIVAMNKAHKQYGLAKRKHGLRQAQERNAMLMADDYTGLAKYGMESKGQPVELEKNEIVVMKNDSGDYKPYMSTGPNDPSHEEGGVQTNLPEGTVVFPNKYKKKVEQALSAGDNATIDKLKGQMMVESTAASLKGAPFSNQARYGKTMNKKSYSYGSGFPTVVGQNPFMQQPGGMQQPMGFGTPMAQFENGGTPKRPMSGAKKDYMLHKRLSNKPGYEEYVKKSGILSPMFDTEVEQGTVDIQRYGIDPTKAEGGVGDYTKSIPSTFVGGRLATPSSDFKVTDEGNVILRPMSPAQRKQLRKGVRKTTKAMKQPKQEVVTGPGFYGTPPASGKLTGMRYGGKGKKC